MSERYKFYGTGVTFMSNSGSSSSSASAKDKNQLSIVNKNQPGKQQIATDDEGRRRFHGAFTGGFQAGYFNTCGSKEGFHPKRFKSSREVGKMGDVGRERDDHRRRQSIEDFMDEDEREEAQKKKLGRVSRAYDGGSGIGDFDDEAMAGFRSVVENDRDGGGDVSISRELGKALYAFVKPVLTGIGHKLLVRMGWRQGKSLGKRKKKVRGNVVFKSEDEQEFRRRYKGQLQEGQDLKNNAWGIGYDPYKGADEFRIRDEHELERKRERYTKEGEKKKRGNAFGLGAFEVDDDVNVYEERPGERNAEYSFELDDEGKSDGDDDENERFGRNNNNDDNNNESLRNPLGVKRLTDRATREAIEKGRKFPGFIESDAVPEETEWFRAPEVPRDFNQLHAFPTNEADDDEKIEEEEEEEEEFLPPPPPQMQKLSIEKLKIIESLANHVARHGSAFEDLAKQKQKNDKKFSFLFGGEGASSYAYALKKAKREEHKRNAVAAKNVLRQQQNSSIIIKNNIRSNTKHDAESRGKILGEQPLLRTSKSETAVMEGDGFDTITKTKNSSSLQTLPPVIEKMKIQPRTEVKKNLSATINENDKSHILATMSSMFTKSAASTVIGAEAPISGGLQTAKEIAEIRKKREEIEAIEEANSKAIQNETDAKKEVLSRLIINTRTTMPWSPALLLCKRLGIKDPYLGREDTRPAKLRATFKTETVDLLPETMQIRLENQPKFMSKRERELNNNNEGDDEKNPPPTRRRNLDEVFVEDGKKMEVPPPPLREKPMDLFKAIFEDSSDDDDDDVEEEEEEEEDPSSEKEEANDEKAVRPPPTFIRQKQTTNKTETTENIKEAEEAPVFLSSSAFAKKRSAPERDDDDLKERKRSKKEKKKKKKKKERKKEKKKRKKEKKKKKRSSKRRDDSSSSSSSSSSGSYSYSSSMS
jgi:G patch domain-containing protein 1